MRKKVRPRSPIESRNAWILLACAVEDHPRFRRNGTGSSDGISKAKRNAPFKPHVHQQSCGHGYTPNDKARVHGHEYTGVTQRTTNFQMLGATPREIRSYIERRRVKYRDF